MSKKKSITLLTIISVILAIVLTMTFLRFEMGVKDYNSAVGAIELDYDMTGGVYYNLTLNQSDEDQQVSEEQTKEVAKEIGQRLEVLGYTAYMVKAVKNTDKDVQDYEIRVEVKGSEGDLNIDRDMLAVATYGELKFYGGTEANPTTQILEGVDVIEDASFYGATGDGAYALTIKFTEQGKKELLDIIDGSVYFLKVTCGLYENGQEIPLFNSTEQNPFDTSVFDGDNREIGIQSGSEQEAKRMAMLFKYGGIDYRYDIANNGKGITITSAFGEDIALKSMVAIITFIVVALALMIVVYKGLGIMSALSLLIFILAETWLLIGVPGIVVSLGSIMGIIGATVICIFAMLSLLQKIKDSFENTQKTVKASISKGFKEALLPTINMHVVVGIVSLLLFIFASGLVKSFAITFGIGVVVSLIASLVFTRMFNALIMPLVSNKEKFFSIKKEEIVSEEV
ncbi:MAG: hypothetical protein E7372_04345 [Clostridiales bacterium]|nr:hypothetical protein [Clostridiales bacterium]